MKKLPENLLTAIEKRAIQEACQVISKKFSIAQIILFGSKARGDSDSESDIDLLILTKYKMERTEQNKITSEVFEI